MPELENLVSSRTRLSSADYLAISANRPRECFAAVLFWAPPSSTACRGPGQSEVCSARQSASKPWSSNTSVEKLNVNDAGGMRRGAGPKNSNGRKNASGGRLSWRNARKPRQEQHSSNNSINKHRHSTSSNQHQGALLLLRERMSSSAPIAAINAGKATIFAAGAEADYHKATKDNESPTRRAVHCAHEVNSPPDAMTRPRSWDMCMVSRVGILTFDDQIDRARTFTTRNC